MYILAADILNGAQSKKNKLPTNGSIFYNFQVWNSLHVQVHEYNVFCGVISVSAECIVPLTATCGMRGFLMSVFVVDWKAFMFL